MDNCSSRPQDTTLIGQDSTPLGAVPVRLARRLALLERSSDRVVRRAEQVGVGIRYLGQAPLFAEPRAYAGVATDWVVYPVADHSDAVLPHQQREALLRLDDAGIDFGLVYIAHEIPKQLMLPTANPQGSTAQPVTIDRERAARAVGAVPLHPDTVVVADQLGRSAERLVRILSKALPVLGLVVAAPFIVAGAAVAALTAGLDPIIFGVIPAGVPVEGQPAAWYVLASWDWPSFPLEPEGG
jgi:hypothetical protein